VTTSISNRIKNTNTASKLHQSRIKAASKLHQSRIKAASKPHQSRNRG
jgi:hypothetical protein